MSLSSFFIKRPVFASVINVLAFIIGIVCWTKLPTFQYPQVSSGSLNVHAENAGSPPVIMEQIAKTLEKAITNVSGIKSTQTNISNGQCNIHLTLDDNADISKITAEVENEMRIAQPDLPQNMRPPVVSKSDLNDKPMMWVTLSSDKYSVVELRTKLADLIRGLKSITGVSNVNVSGEHGMPKAYAMVITLDPIKMYTYGISAQQVQDAIQTQNYISPAAQIISNNTIYAAITDASLSTVDEFNDIVISTSKEGSIVKMSDIADVSLEMHNRNDSFSALNGKEIAYASITAQSKANVVQIAKQVTKKINTISQSIGNDMQIEILLDNTQYISSSLKRVMKTILEAAILIAILTLLFFRSVISSIIPLITLPICLASGMTIMYMFNFSINIMTLLANLLAVGLVVDDAFLVLENIYSKIEHGMPILRASMIGISEIQFSVIAMTLTIVAVYAPFMLSTTMVGRIFKEFAFVLAGMILVSGAVALILTPMMSAQLLKWNKELKLWPIIKFNELFYKLEKLYIQSLQFILHHRKKFIGICIMIFFASILIAKYGLKSIMIPDEDQGIMNISLTFEPGTRVESARHILVQIEDIVRNILTKKENEKINLLTSYSESATSERGAILVTLPSKGRRSTQKLSKLIQDAIEPIFGDYLPHISTGSSPLDSGDRDFSIYIKSINGKEALSKASTVVSQCMRAIGGSTILQSRTNPEPVYRYIFNRDISADLNIPLNFIDKIFAAVRSNPPAGYYNYAKEDGSKVRTTVVTKLDDYSQMYTMLLCDRHNRQTKQNNEYHHDMHNNMIPVIELLQENDFIYQAPSIMHKDGIDAITMSCSIQGSPLSQYQKLQKLLQNQLPEGVSIEPGASLEKLIEEGNNLILMFVLAIIFIYLIMAAQFESILNPLIVMCTVPLTISGAIIGLKLFPMGSLNLYSQIGMITLIALITKHGIMLVDLFSKKIDESQSGGIEDQQEAYVLTGEVDSLNSDTELITDLQHNHKIVQGIVQSALHKEHVVNAVLETAKDRFRPIIMTTLAMVLGSIPLIFPSGYGYELTQQIGIVLVFGLTFGTIVTTFLIPCILVMMSKYMKK